MFPYPAGQPLIVADCHTPSSTGSICSLIRSNVPGKFICLNPCKSAIVDSVKHVGSVKRDYAFSSRPPMSSVKPNFEPHFKTAPGTTEVPWDVAELPQAHEPSKFSIQNLVTKPRTLKLGFLLGSLCELTLPWGLTTDTQVVSNKRQNIKKQLKVLQKLDKPFMAKFEDLLIGLYKSFSWDKKPGLPHLAELEIHTGRVPEVFVRLNVMMPQCHRDCPNPCQQMADGWHYQGCRQQRF